MSQTLLSLRSLTLNAVRLASTSSPMVKTPVPLFGIDGRYVTAIWSAAAKQKKLDVVDSDLKQLLLASQKDKRFQDFLFNPLVKAKEKKEILSKATIKLSDLTLNLIGVLSENGRIKMLPAVAKIFNRVMAISRGELECTVTTAKPIDDSTRKEIEQSLNGFVKGQKLSLTLKVDPSILGGMLVDFGGEHFIDMSIRSKFNFYSNLIKQAV